MSSHTPGPWGAEKHPDGHFEITSDGSVLADVHGDDNEPLSWPVTDNARLIAAAPELLNEAEAAHGVLCGCTSGETCGAPSLFAVIRKARGRS